MVPPLPIGTITQSGTAKLLINFVGNGFLGFNHEWVEFGGGLVPACFFG